MENVGSKNPDSKTEHRNLIHFAYRFRHKIKFRAEMWQKMKDVGVKESNVSDNGKVALKALNVVQI